MKMKPKLRRFHGKLHLCFAILNIHLRSAGMAARLLEFLLLITDGKLWRWTGLDFVCRVLLPVGDPQRGAGYPCSLRSLLICATTHGVLQWELAGPPLQTRHLLLHLWHSWPLRCWHEDASHSALRKP